MPTIKDCQEARVIRTLSLIFGNRNADQNFMAPSQDDRIILVEVGGSSEEPLYIVSYSKGEPRTTNQREIDDYLMNSLP